MVGDERRELRTAIPDAFVSYTPQGALPSLYSCSSGKSTSCQLGDDRAPTSCQPIFGSGDRPLRRTDAVDHWQSSLLGHLISDRISLPRCSSVRSYSALEIRWLLFTYFFLTFDSLAFHDLSPPCSQSVSGLSD